MDERFDGVLRHKLTRTNDHYVPLTTQVPFFKSDFPVQGMDFDHSNSVTRNSPMFYSSRENQRQCRDNSRRCHCAD